jgi:prophage antirepressor-like protein
MFPIKVLTYIPYTSHFHYYCRDHLGDNRVVVGEDVAKALGYTAPRNALATHVDEEDKTTALIQCTGSNYKSKSIIINESGLYSLILSSKLDRARVAAGETTQSITPSSGGGSGSGDPGDVTP